MMIVYIAGLQAIPDSLREAAMIDGANARTETFPCNYSKHDAIDNNMYILNNNKLIQTL